MDIGEIDEGDHARTLPGDHVSRGQRQTRLADTAGSQQDKQRFRRIGVEVEDRLHEVVAPDEFMRQCGQRVGNDNRGSSCPCRGIKRCVLRQDLVFEREKLYGGGDPELVGEEAAHALEGVQRVSLAAGSIERNHELPPPMLAIRSFRYGAFDVCHEPIVVTRDQTRIKQILHSASVNFFKSGAGGHSEWKMLEPGERLFRSVSQSLPKKSRCSLCRSCAQSCPAFGREALDAECVDSIGCHRQQVPSLAIQHD
jgi:hypothetical protein